jgi:hypothetical protein
LVGKSLPIICGKKISQQPPHVFAQQLPHVEPQLSPAGMATDGAAAAAAFPLPSTRTTGARFSAARAAPNPRAKLVPIAASDHRSFMGTLPYPSGRFVPGR